MINWSSTDELIVNLQNNYRLKVEERIGIGACSGIENDPNENICMPAELNLKEQKILENIESYYGRKYPDASRYILLCCTKLYE